VGDAPPNGRGGASQHRGRSAGELEELVAAYEAKGLETGLARQVAEALTARDLVAAHADAELDLESIAPARANIYAALSAGLFYGLGATVPLVAMRWLPTRERSELAFIPAPGARIDGVGSQPG
jgi:VIT1/CCC1 family predicted Fe2+/Mn2+ transporter